MKKYINKIAAFLCAVVLIVSVLAGTGTALAYDNDSENITPLWSNDKQTDDEKSTQSLRG